MLGQTVWTLGRKQAAAAAMAAEPVYWADARACVAWVSLVVTMRVPGGCWRTWANCPGTD